MEKTINGIKFNSIKTAGVEKAAWPLILAGQQGPDEDGGIINAVDIDWNDAEIPYGDLETGETVSINSTGELLSLVSNMQQEIFVLSAAVAALSENSGNTHETSVEDIWHYMDNPGDWLYFNPATCYTVDNMPVKWTIVGGSFNPLGSSLPLDITGTNPHTLLFRGGIDSRLFVFYGTLDGGYRYQESWDGSITMPTDTRDQDAKFLDECLN